MLLKIENSERNLELVERLNLALAALDAASSVLVKVSDQRGFVENEIMDLKAEKQRLESKIEELNKNIEQEEQDIKKLKEKQKSEFLESAIQYLTKGIKDSRQILATSVKNLSITEGLLQESEQRYQSLGYVISNTEAKKRVCYKKIQDISRELQQENNINLFAELIVSLKENGAKTIEIIEIADVQSGSEQAQ